MMHYDETTLDRDPPQRNAMPHAKIARQKTAHPSILSPFLSMPDSSAEYREIVNQNSTSSCLGGNCPDTQASHALLYGASAVYVAYVVALAVPQPLLVWYPLALAGGAGGGGLTGGLPTPSIRRNKPNGHGP